MRDIAARFGRKRLAGGLALLAGALLVAIGTIIAFAGGGGNSEAAPQATVAPTSGATPTPSATETPEPAPTPILHAGILDGMPMDEDEWQARKDQLPIAVMIDNTAAAYPHAGLDRADLVYEGFVEGGITRLMAVYWRLEADKILPVRSARTPFVVWASELGAMYGHAGGASPENDANALGQIVEWGIRDLNAFSPGTDNYYYRDAERSGPHDLATSTAYLLEAGSNLGFAGPPVLESWLFREPGATLPPASAAEGIEIDFSGRGVPWQYIQWRWDSAKRRYLRSQFGREHRDAVTDEQLAFSTVIVMRTELIVVDEEGHVVLEQFGEGTATVFTGGRAFEGMWKKADREGRTRFYGEDGNEIVFERGPIWIEVIGRQSDFASYEDASGLPPMPEYELPPPGTFPSEPTDATPTPEATATAEEETPSPTAAPTATPTPGTPRPTPTPTLTPTPTVDPTL